MLSNADYVLEISNTLVRLYTVSKIYDMEFYIMYVRTYLV